MNAIVQRFKKDLQYYKFCSYGFLKNLRFYEPFLFLFFIDQGLSFLQIGILISIREISRNILEIPAGIIADSIGRKKTLASSFIFYIIAFTVYFFGHTYVIFIVAMLVYSLGDSFRTGTHKAMIFDYLKIKGWKDQKVYYYGHTRSWSQLGSSLSSLIAAGLVILSGNYRMIFLYSILPYILDLLLILSYPNQLDGQTKEINEKRIAKKFKGVFLDFINSFRQLKILRAMSNLSFHTGYYQALKDYLQPVIKTLALSLPFFLDLGDKQRTAIFIGIIYFFVYLFTSFSSRKSGSFAHRFQNLMIPLNWTLLVGIGFGLFSGLFYELNIPLFAVLFYIIIYIIENLRKPVGVAYVTEVIDKDILATVLSAESQAHTLIAALLAPLIGWLADQLGIGYAIMGVSILIICIAPFYWLTGKNQAPGKKK